MLTSELSSPSSGRPRAASTRTPSSRRPSRTCAPRATRGCSSSTRTSTSRCTRGSTGRSRGSSRCRRRGSRTSPRFNSAGPRPKLWARPARRARGGFRAAGAVAGRCAGQPGSYQIAPAPPRARLTKVHPEEQQLWLSQASESRDEGERPCTPRGAPRGPERSLRRPPPSPPFCMYLLDPFLEHSKKIMIYKTA